MADRSVLVCPSDITADERAVVAGYDPGSYYYLGYIITNQDEAEAFAEAYRARLAEGGSFEEDLPVPESHGGGVIQRLTEANLNQPGIRASSVPVVFDRANNHIPDGMNVLYADGRVAFLRLNEAFPATEELLDLLDELETETTAAYAVP
jgi:prepilin-type processing-associated H-X9-DG protein